MAARADYDVVVVDVMLPGMDGLEVCRRLRRGGLRAPVVVISARDDITARDLRAADADQFLGKPFAVAELGVRLRRAPTHVEWAAPVSIAAGSSQPEQPPVSRRWWMRRSLYPRGRR